MNRFTIAILLIFSVLSSCKKEEVSYEFDFEVKGIANADVSIGESKVLDLEVKTLNGTPENVVLSLSDVPDGIIYSFENVEGVADYYTSLALVATKQAKVGTYKISLQAAAGDLVKNYEIDMVVDGSLSMVMVVYDASNWTPESNYGKLADKATVNLYTDEASLKANTPYYTVETGEDGRAYFYKLNPGNYLFKVEKGNLSNIAEKKLVNGTMSGFVTTGIFRFTSEILVSSQPGAKIGDIRFRDIDGDWKITDNDRSTNDVLSIYKDVLSEKIIWIAE